MTGLVAPAVLLAILFAASGFLLDLRTLPRASARRREVRSVSVVVPARDEEKTLPALLASLRQLSANVGAVVVVDDGSRDATASVARRGGATVLPAGDPPPGWTGKAWACHVGVRSTSGDHLLFLDADTSLAPDALDGLLEVHDAYPGLVSVQPYHTVVRPYEQLSSYFNVVSVLASGAFRRHPDGRPMAFGPCLLTSRAAYERAGGHLAVRSEILDDVELAAAYHRAGLPVRCVVGGQSVQMRSYPGGIGQWAEGWTKNFASGASAAEPGPAVGGVAWVSAHHAVAVGAALSVAHSDPVWSMVAWVVAWVAVAWQLRWVLRRLGSFRWWTWALFPVPLLAFDLLFARSVVRTIVRRSVRWRGREVRLDPHGSASDGA